MKHNIVFTVLACGQVFGLCVILGLILFNDIVCFNEPKLWIISLEFSFAVFVIFTYLAIWGNVYRITALEQTVATLEQRVEVLEAQPVPALYIEAQEIGMVACPWGTSPFTNTDGIHGGCFLGCR